MEIEMGFFLAILEKPINWTDILQSLHLNPNIDFYQKFYEPLLQERIKAIITGSWATTMETTEKHIVELFEGSLTGKKPLKLLISYYVCSSN